LNGEIVLLGRLHGVSTPANELLQRTANDLALSLPARLRRRGRAPAPARLIRAVQHVDALACCGHGLELRAI
jgi:2-dehydropantoate 2-reductase